MSRSRGLKNRWFGSNFSKITRPVTAIKSLKFALFFKVSHQILRSHGLIIWQFESNLSKIATPVAAIKSLRFALFNTGRVFSCDQAALWMAQSICLSVCLSVTPFSLCSHHRIIMKFTKVLTNDRSDVHAKGQGQRSRVNLTVSGPLLQFEFTNDDEMMHKSWCCSGEVPYCFSRSFVKFQGHTAKKIVEFDPDWVPSDCNSSLNPPMATEWCTKLEVA